MCSIRRLFLIDSICHTSNNSSLVGKTSCFVTIKTTWHIYFCKLISCIIIFWLLQLKVIQIMHSPDHREDRTCTVVTCAHLAVRQQWDICHWQDNWVLLDKQRWAGAWTMCQEQRPLTKLGCTWLSGRTYSIHEKNQCHTLKITNSFHFFQFVSLFHKLSTYCR